MKPRKCPDEEILSSFEIDVDCQEPELDKVTGKLKLKSKSKSKSKSIKKQKRHVPIERVSRLAAIQS